MELFNRYETELDLLDLAFGEGGADYCNPKEYSVTKEECIHYLNDLKKGRELNKKWKDSRVKIIRALVISFCIIICISLPFLLVWGLDVIGLGGWSFFVYYAVLCIIIGFSRWLYCSVDNNLRYSKRYNSSLFPAINMNVEKLFDDYLVKKRRYRSGVKSENGKGNGY